MGWPATASARFGTIPLPDARTTPCRATKATGSKPFATGLVLLCRPGGETGHRRVEGNSAHVLVDLEAVAQRRESALLAVDALADPAGDADRRGAVEVLEVDAVAVHHLARVLHLAPEADGVHDGRRVVAGGVLVDAARQAEVGGAVGHARDLDAQQARRHEGCEQVPLGAGPAEAGEADPRRAEPLGDVARDVDADHVERNPAGARSAQRRQPVAHLLEAHAEPAS